MALQTSGAISLSDIQTEFGGSNPISLSEYYGAASGIPASGTISLSNFYGASAGWTLTQGVSGSFYGYGTGVGSISPSTLNGANLITVGLSVITIKGSTSYLFIVAVSGNRAQNFFASINESSLGTKTTASANSFAYDSNSGNTTWTWQLTSAPANWDGSGDLTVVFV